MEGGGELEAQRPQDGRAFLWAQAFGPADIPIVRVVAFPGLLTSSQASVLGTHPADFPSISDQAPRPAVPALGQTGPGLSC